MRREVAGPEHTGDHALCVTVCNVEVVSDERFTDLQAVDVQLSSPSGSHGDLR